MKHMVLILVIGWLATGCNRAELEQLRQVREQLETENRSLKNSLSKVQPQLERMEEIDKRMNFWVDQMRDVKARIATNMGDIEVSFFPEKAPIHCFNFITRAESGFYDNTKFHRVIKGFMLQGGDPNSKNQNPYDDGGGGPFVNIPHEFNDTRHVPGILSMARVSDVSAGAGSQFFIMHGASPNLDVQYTAFGTVSKGMDVVNKIADVEILTSDPRLQNRPARPVVIQRIELFR